MSTSQPGEGSFDARTLPGGQQPAMRNDNAGAPTCIPLRSGTLTLSVARAAIGLAQLCGFGSRRNKKRGFVFISKVLGKHYPVRPSRMAEVHARLAAPLCPLAEGTVVVALAETAVGLGHGIYERLLELTPSSELLFLHTTRYRLDRPLALQFEEHHSHAPEHLLYEPADPLDGRLFRNAASLILVDDEVTTGGTLVNLALAFRRVNPRLERLRIVTLTDWLDDRARAVVRQRIGLPTEFHSLLQGSYAFRPNGQFDPGRALAAIGRGELKDHCLAANFGRVGIRRRLDFDFQALLGQVDWRPERKTLVLGTGEFMYPPFRLACFLEQQGCDVHFQATTRSPLLVGDDIASSIEFVDNYHDEIPNFVYNVAGRSYDQRLVCYETRPLPASHRLPEMLGAQAVFFC